MHHFEWAAHMVPIISYTIDLCSVLSSAAVVTDWAHVCVVDMQHDGWQKEKDGWERHGGVISNLTGMIKKLERICLHQIHKGVLYIDEIKVIKLCDLSRCMLGNWTVAYLDQVMVNTQPVNYVRYATVPIFWYCCAINHISASIFTSKDYENDITPWIR